MAQEVTMPKLSDSMEEGRIVQWLKHEGDEVSEGDVPGIVVSRVNMSTKFAKELLDAMQDSWSKYATVRGIQNLPEVPPRDT